MVKRKYHWKLLRILWSCPSVSHVSFCPATEDYTEANCDEKSMWKNT